MRCPQCDGRTEVIDTVASGPRGEFRRRRRCVDKACGHRFSTLEVPIEGHTPLNPLEIGKEPRRRSPKGTAP